MLNRKQPPCVNVIRAPKSQCTSADADRNALRFISSRRRIWAVIFHYVHTAGWSLLSPVGPVLNAQFCLRCHGDAWSNIHVFLYTGLLHAVTFNYGIDPWWAKESLISPHLTFSYLTFPYSRHLPNQKNIS